MSTCAVACGWHRLLAALSVGGGGDGGSGVDGGRGSGVVSGGFAVLVKSGFAVLVGSGFAVALRPGRTRYRVVGCRDSGAVHVRSTHTPQGRTPREARQHMLTRARAHLDFLHTVQVVVDRQTHVAVCH